MATIAIIDDEAPILNLIGQLCRRMGHKPAMFQTGREGLAGLEKNPPDLVIVDLRIGDVNGLEIIQQCRAKHPRTQVVMVTGYGSVETAVEAMKLGAFDYLTKPFALEDLHQTIDRALRHGSQPPAVTADAPLPPPETGMLPMPVLPAAAAASSSASATSPAGGKLSALQAKSVPVLPSATGAGTGAAGNSPGAAPFIAESPAMRELLKMVRKVANHDSPVLLEGEFGSGKQAVARMLHNASGRRGAAFKVLACGALPENLLEQELFGGGGGISSGGSSAGFSSAPGGQGETAGPGGPAGAAVAAAAAAAGTGTVPAIFQRAAGGTVVLEEIQALPLRLQVLLDALLEDLNNRRLNGGPLGPDHDFRLVATSSAPLEQLAREGKFREDLYYRLSVIPLTIPPLRTRREDIGPLASHFLHHYSRLTGTPQKEADPQAVRLLEEYSWPGNVGELRNAIERACAFADDHRISPADLPPKITRKPDPEAAVSGTDAAAAAAMAVMDGAAGSAAGDSQNPGGRAVADAVPPPLPVGTTLSDFIKKQERLFIRETLRHHSGSREKTASTLGVSIATLYRKMELKGGDGDSIS